MRRRRKNELAFNSTWGDLANYNTERSRGVVHTAEKDAEMAAKQAAYDQWLVTDFARHGIKIIYVD